MKFHGLVFLAFPAVIFSYPFMGGGSKEDILREAHENIKIKEHHVDTKVEERQLLTTLTNTVGILTGILGSLASSVNPDNKRPQPGFTFQAPGPNDSRGPCPALNLLANYGYLPRNGYVSFGQVVKATADGFNMGTDLATILAVFATLTTGDIATESWWLGTNPSTKVGGLNRHSTVEADISPNKEDFYLGCGDNHHISSRMFAQNVGIVARSASKQFDIPNMAQQYKLNSQFSQKNNPYLYYFPFPSIVSVVAFNFYPAFFSNGTFGAGGVANYESISNIIGAKYNSRRGQFEYVPEKWPENWYRRARPYGAVEGLLEGFTKIYPANPVPMPLGQLGTDNLNLATVLCTAFQGVNSITPLILAGQTQAASAAVSWAAAKLDLLAPGTILGCPKSTLSPNKPGGPLNPPPSVSANTGNNVYNKIYFQTAPTTPQCRHTFNP